MGPELVNMGPELVNMGPELVNMGNVKIDVGARGCPERAGTAQPPDVFLKRQRRVENLTAVEVWYGIVRHLNSSPGRGRRGGWVLAERLLCEAQRKL